MGFVDLVDGSGTVQGKVDMSTLSGVESVDGFLEEAFELWFRGFVSDL